MFLESANFLDTLDSQLATEVQWKTAYGHTLQRFTTSVRCDLSPSSSRKLFIIQKFRRRVCASDLPPLNTARPRIQQQFSSLFFLQAPVERMSRSQSHCPQAHFHRHHPGAPCPREGRPPPPRSALSCPPVAKSVLSNSTPKH